MKKILRVLKKEKSIFLFLDAKKRHQIMELLSSREVKYLAGLAFCPIVILLVMFYLASGGNSESPLPAFGSQFASLEPVHSLESEEFVVTNTGAGVVAPDRSKDIAYSIQRGDTLSEIAQRYNVDITALADLNSIIDHNNLRENTIIHIPSYNRESETLEDLKQRYQQKIEVSRQPIVDAVRPLAISYEGSSDGIGYTMRFFISEDTNPGNLNGYQWNLGNGRRSFRESTYWTYKNPGTYKVSMRATDSEGNVYRSNILFVDIPYPGSRNGNQMRFYNLGSIDETLTVPGSVASVYNYKSLLEAPILKVGEEISATGTNTVYRFLQPGYYQLTSQKKEEMYRNYVFVSPVKTFHADQNIRTMNWYRTQFNTGSVSNCGPTVVSMAVAWAKLLYKPVHMVRDYVGWKGDGGIGLGEIRDTLKHYDVDVQFQVTRNVEDIFSILNQGKLAVVLYNTGGVSRSTRDIKEDFYGRYYGDEVGHYIIIKGYSQDKRYFVVYDPIPSDWSSNNLRYNDGISMIGRNRYYDAQELFRSMKRRDVLVIKQSL